MKILNSVIFYSFLFTCSDRCFPYLITEGVVTDGSFYHIDSTLTSDMTFNRFQQAYLYATFFLNLAFKNYLSKFLNVLEAGIMDAESLISSIIVVQCCRGVLSCSAIVECCRAVLACSAVAQCCLAMRVAQCKSCSPDRSVRASQAGTQQSGP